MNTFVELIIGLAVVLMCWFTLAFKWVDPIFNFWIIIGCIIFIVVLYLKDGIKNIIGKIQWTPTSIISVIIVFTCALLAILDRNIPQFISNGFFLVTGFYLGAKIKE